MYKKGFILFLFILLFNLNAKCSSAEEMENTPLSLKDFSAKLYNTLNGKSYSEYIAKYYLVKPFVLFLWNMDKLMKANYRYNESRQAYWPTLIKKLFTTVEGLKENYFINYLTENDFFNKKIATEKIKIIKVKERSLIMWILKYSFEKVEKVHKKLLENEEVYEIGYMLTEPKKYEAYVYPNDDRFTYIEEEPKYYHYVVNMKEKEDDSDDWRVIFLSEYSLLFETDGIQ